MGSYSLPLLYWADLWTIEGAIFQVHGGGPGARHNFDEYFDTC
jgi:hypothetical protein